MRNELNYNMTISPANLATTGEKLYIPPPKGGYRLKALTLKVQTISGATSWALQLNKYDRNGTLLASNVLQSNLTLPSGTTAGATIVYKFAPRNVVRGGVTLYYGFNSQRNSACENDEFYVLNVVTAATTLTADVTACLEVF